MRRALSLVALVIAGCVGPGRQSGDVAYYDLGPPGRFESATPALLVNGVTVESPSWLDRTSLQFRLAYANAARRESYAESRWVAPPEELLEQAIDRAVVAGEQIGAGSGCRLRLELDEFIHVFDEPGVSRGVVELRASLLAPGSGQVLARRRFGASRPAATANARGGIEALREATAELGGRMREWLITLERNSAQGSNLSSRCRGV